MATPKQLLAQAEDALFRRDLHTAIDSSLRVIEMECQDLGLEFRASKGLSTLPAIGLHMKASDLASSSNTTSHLTSSLEILVQALVESERTADARLVLEMAFAESQTECPPQILWMWMRLLISQDQLRDVCPLITRFIPTSPPGPGPSDTTHLHGTTTGTITTGGMGEGEREGQREEGVLSLDDVRCEAVQCVLVPLGEWQWAAHILPHTSHPAYMDLKALLEKSEKMASTAANPRAARAVTASRPGGGGGGGSGSEGRMPDSLSSIAHSLQAQFAQFLPKGKGWLATLPVVLFVLVFLIGSGFRGLVRRSGSVLQRFSRLLLQFGMPTAIQR